MKITSLTIVRDSLMLAKSMMDREANANPYNSELQEKICALNYIIYDINKMIYEKRAEKTKMVTDNQLVNMINQYMPTYSEWDLAMNGEKLRFAKSYRANHLCSLSEALSLFYYIQYLWSKNIDYNMFVDSIDHKKGMVVAILETKE